jgi:DNA-binding transcriptional MerR regulator
LERVHFIQRAQTPDISLKEISTLLALGDNAPESGALIAEGKLLPVRSKIIHLVAVRPVLEEPIRRCDAYPDAASSPKICALSEPTILRAALQD